VCSLVDVPCCQSLDSRICSVWTRRDELLMSQIGRVLLTNIQIYGAEKLWHQLRRHGTAVAHCTVERSGVLCGNAL